MPSSSLLDQATLQQLFQEPISPLNTYGQGILALAMQRRKAEQDLKLEQQKQLFDLQLQKLREDSANAALKTRLETEHNFKTADEKEQDRRLMVSNAKEYGANIPMDADYETALNAFVKAHGESMVSLYKRAGEAIRTITEQTGMTGMEYARRVAEQIASSPELTKFTPVEQEYIRNNPDKIKEIRAKYAKDPKKYEQFKAAEKYAVDLVTAQIEKESNSKASVVAATAQLRMVNDAISAARKRAPLSAAQEDAVNVAYHDAAFPPAATDTAQSLPPPRLKRQQGPTNATSSDPRESVFRRWWYGKDATPPVPGVSAVPSNLNAPTLDLPPATMPQIPTGTISDTLENLRRQSLGIPVVAPVRAPIGAPSAGEAAIIPGQENPIDPSVLSALKLQSTLRDAAANQNALLPTSFPLLPVAGR